MAELGFEDHSSVGVKAANVAALGKLGFKAGVVPEGYAIPFHFYDAFMRHNGLYDEAGKMIEEPGFLTDTQLRVESLKRFRRKVKDGDTPEWMLDELKSLQGSVRPLPADPPAIQHQQRRPAGIQRRRVVRLLHSPPGRGPPIAKSVKQVYASLWNFRAFEEREFFRIDHLAAAMGVLVHPNYSGELANGVAVSEDIAYQSGGYGRPRMYYVNAQVGEDLVTNPEQESTPEEILLSTRGQRFDRVIRRSNPLGERQPAAQRGAPRRTARIPAPDPQQVQGGVWRRSQRPVRHGDRVQDHIRRPAGHQAGPAVGFPLAILGAGVWKTMQTSMPDRVMGIAVGA